MFYVCRIFPAELSFSVRDGRKLLSVSILPDVFTSPNFPDSQMRTETSMAAPAKLESNRVFREDRNIKVVKVVLVGNPNVGKSLFFNYLTGTYMEVSNFPGTTVSVTKGKFKDYDIYDTPGIYGVSSFNDEERVARDIILEADVVINIVNSLYLERDLFLTRQLIDMGKKMCVFLNFADEVKKKNIKIEYDKLSKLLGVSVFCTSAVDSRGFEFLEEGIRTAKQGIDDPEIFAVIAPLGLKNILRHDALLIKEGDPEVSKRLNEPIGTPDDREIIYIKRRSSVNEIVSEVEFEDSSRGKFLNKLSSLVINPYTGIPFLMFVLTVFYFIIGDLVAQRLVTYTEKELGRRYFEYNLKSLVADYSAVAIDVSVIDQAGKKIFVKNFVFPRGMKSDEIQRTEFKYYSNLPHSVLSFKYTNVLARFLFGDFGVISMTVTYLVFLLFPLVLAFYFSMAFLEDSGYLPRLAALSDRTLNCLGLNGRAVIPIILGFGCVTMATITTRILGSHRERTIATAILQFVIPCSAQLAVIAVLMSTAGLAPFLIYVTVILIVLIVLSTGLNKMLPGKSMPLLIDLPPMRLPRLSNLLKKTFYRSIDFLKEASLWFFVGAAIVGIMEMTGLLEVFQNILAPFTVHWLKLPKEAANAFIMGMVRRDFGTAGLFDLHLTAMQATVAIITITLFVPCIASFMVMLKERGWKEGWAIWFGAWIGAFTIGGLVAQIIVR